MTHRLRYTGVQETVFQTGNVGLVEPKGEFDVPDELLLRFMRRPDVEHAGECPAPPCKCGMEPELKTRKRSRQAKTPAAARTTTPEGESSPDDEDDPDPRSAGTG